jgi:putative membrane protein
MWQKLSALPIFAFVVLVEPLQALAQSSPDSLPSRGYGPGMHMWGDGYGPFWWGGPIMMILFWVLVIGAVVAIVAFFMRGGRRGDGAHRGSSRHAGGDPMHSALQILGERFARGEIPKDEYEDKKAALLSGARR